MHRRLLPIALLIAGMATPASARADGLPVLGFAPNNTTIHGGHFAYTTRISGSHTRLERRTVTGRLIRRTRIAGAFTIPLVAYDGSPSGVSADGRTLVLIRPRTRFPQPRTTLAVVDPGTLTVRRKIVLRGDFSFDAISPNGRWLYLINYFSRDPTQYRVRALDAVSGRLLPRDIVDPHDRGETMRGNPLTRVESADGRWAYTLYDGLGHPFVHALDTARLTARCIDLPTGSLWSGRLRLLPDAHRLLVTLNHRTRATIDTRRLAVVPVPSKPQAAQPRDTTRKAAQHRDSTPAALFVIAGVCLAVAAAYGARRSIVQRVPPARV